MKKGTSVKIKSTGQIGSIEKWNGNDDQALVNCLPAFLGYVNKADIVKIK